MQRSSSPRTPWKSACDCWLAHLLTRDWRIIRPGMACRFLFDYYFRAPKKSEFEKKLQARARSVLLTWKHCQSRVPEISGTRDGRPVK